MAVCATPYMYTRMYVYFCVCVIEFGHNVCFLFVYFLQISDLYCLCSVLQIKKKGNLTNF